MLPSKSILVYKSKNKSRQKALWLWTPFNINTITAAPHWLVAVFSATVATP